VSWKTIDGEWLPLLVAVILILFYNQAFFQNVFKIYHLSLATILFLISLTITITCALTLILVIFNWAPVRKPLLVSIFLVSSVTAYFMDSYNVIIDSSMIRNISETNFREATDLFNWRLILYFVVLGLIPAILVVKIPIKHASIKQTVLKKSKYLVLTIIVLVIQPLVFGKSYASFLREHKAVRYYINPVTPLYSLLKYIDNSLTARTPVVLSEIGKDAVISTADIGRELMILVVGETARADHFSLNGYSRKTNPLLEKEAVISFPNVVSCGTTTAVSVPCMFSLATHKEFNPDSLQENLLDVLSGAGIHVLWRDNNSDSKGVAIRVPYEDFKSSELNTICDIECRDEGMLVGLQDYINSKDSGDILIVLHQMGNHGPSYYKRYPKSFERFAPVCETNELAKCTTHSVVNAYDNAILYTDYFLSKVITLLKQNCEKFEAGMVYISDHGESLGENGLYLHGIPYFIAPNSQVNVGAVLWVDHRVPNIDINTVKETKTKAFSHDHIFHTILGFFEVETSIYDSKLDIFNKYASR